MKVERRNAGEGAAGLSNSVEPILLGGGEPCRLAALAGSQLYGWKGTCLGGRPGAEVGNFGNLKAGLHFWRTQRFAGANITAGGHELLRVGLGSRRLGFGENRAGA
jgi:hypothetical protein